MERLARGEVLRDCPHSILFDVVIAKPIPFRLELCAVQVNVLALLAFKANGRQALFNVP